MKNFEYAARDGNGIKRVGLFQANSEQEVLHTWGISGSPRFRSRSWGGTGKEKDKHRLRKRIKSEEMANFCWQLNTMLEGGIPITEAADTIAEDIDNEVLQKTLKWIVEKMKTGEAFSDSLAEFPKIFNPVFRAMILAGETGGSLPWCCSGWASISTTRTP